MRYSCSGLDAGMADVAPSDEVWRVYETLARTQREHNELSKSIDSYKKCLECAGHRGEEDKQFVYYNEIGEMLFQLGDYLGAIGSHSQAVDIARRTAMDKIQLTDCRLKMAYNHMRLKEFEIAQELFESCREDYVKLYGEDHPNAVTIKEQLDLSIKLQPKEE